MHRRHPLGQGAVYSGRSRMLDIRAIRARSIWRLAFFLLVLGAAFGTQAEPPSFRIPGRKPDSKEPWGAFLGRAAHFAIGREYRVQHPSNRVFLDPANLSRIVKEGKLGTPSVFRRS